MQTEKITIFTTGGTFDKIYFDANSHFSVGKPQVIPIFAEANVTIPYEVIPLLRKDSLDITSEDRKEINQAIIECSSQRIIIIHGTDTMVKSAKALKNQAIKNKTIVFVGAMQPASMRYTDAPFNLGFALASVQLLTSGIHITMNGHIFPYDQVEKNLTAGKFEYKP